MAADIRDNILHDYATYSYHFKLYMIPVNEYNTIVSTPEGIDVTKIHTQKFSKRVVILESGATSSSINSVTINSAANVDHSTTTLISMQVIQPKGYGLFETIVMASAMCGIPENSLRSSRCLLELSFMGIDDNGVSRSNISTITYPVSITNIVTSISSAGAVYDMTLTINTPHSSRDDFSLSPVLMSLGDVRTIDVFFDKLKDALNMAYQEDTTNGQVFVNKCRFEIDPALLGHEIKGSDESNPISDYQLVYSDNTAPTIIIPKGASIPSIIEGVCANIKPITDLLLNGKYTGKAVYIEPVVVQGEYDPAINSYSSIITWHIKLKSIYKPLPQMQHYEGLDEILEIGSLAKVYEYYYTGNNTEVVSVDLDYNNLYGLTMAAYETITSNYANQSGLAPSVVRSNTEVLQRSQSDSRKASSEFSAKPAYSDSTGTDVFYVDGISHIDESVIAKIAPHYTKRVVDSSDSQSNTTSEVDSDRGKYMTELNNIRNLHNGYLTQATLSIRGDPYWLTPNNIYMKHNSSHSSPSTFNLLYLKMGYPIDETVDIHVDEFISALYQVGSIVSEFNNGQFTQKLSCARLTSIPRTAIDTRIKRK